MKGPEDDDYIDFTDHIPGVSEEHAQWESDLLNDFLNSVEEETE